MRTIALLAVVGLMSLGAGDATRAVVGEKKGSEKKSPALEDGPWIVRPLRVVESKPVVVNEAEFIAVTESEWKFAKPVNELAPIDIQLRIVNRSKSDLAFPTFETFRLAIKKAAGKCVDDFGGADMTIAARPLVIGPGGGYSICRQAQLRWDAKRAVGELSYHDGTGRIAHFKNLGVGKYKLSFSYSTKHATAKLLMAGIKGVPIWSGEAHTAEAPFEIVAP